MKQLEDNKEKSRALAVIRDDEGFDWSELLPGEDAVGYAFMAKSEPVPFKDTRPEEQRYAYRKMIAQQRMIRISGIYLEAKRVRRWDPDKECYLDPDGNIAIDHNTLDLETIIKEMKEEDEYWQRKWWGSGDEKEEEKKERERERRKAKEG
ncbi:hypothetical protein HanIR_Chr07g0302561 [Helianthus annuus]|nr:hypothetical protein HanIR_Chr07g0302561 [Helianthus annuus]